MKMERPSSLLIVLALLLVLIGLVVAAFIHHSIERIHRDAALVNQAGMVRGSIQRALWFELAGETVLSEAAMADVDRRLEEFVRGDSPYREAFVHLAGAWATLRGEMLAVRDDPRDGDAVRLLVGSEAVWEASNRAVLATQAYSEGKVRGIRLVYGILLVNVLAALSVLWLVNFRVRRRMEPQALHDALTGLLNRHSYNEDVAQEIERCRRYRRPLSLILFDIDHFKSINDRFGHGAGDRVLAGIAALAQRMVRTSDLLFRIGGEEFVVLSPETSLDEAVVLADKLRRAVMEMTCAPAAGLTLSCGVAGLREGETGESLLQRADAALYRAKEGGRNRTVTG